MTALHPLFLKLSGRRVVIVGGGKVAAAKLMQLAGTGADLFVVAPEFHPEIVASGVGMRVARRPFVPSDLDGAWLVVAELHRAPTARVDPTSVTPAGACNGILRTRALARSSRSPASAVGPGSQQRRYLGEQRSSWATSGLPIARQPLPRCRPNCE